MQSLKQALVLIAVILLANLCRATDPIDNRKLDTDKLFGKLQLVGGDVYRGEFGNSEDAFGSLIWRCPSFVSDLIIPWSAIENVVQPPNRHKKSELGSEPQFSS